MTHDVKLASKPTTKPRRKGRNAETAKTDLIDAGRIEFAATGFSATGIEAIAARTGLNKKMIYHYFGSKEGLYIAVLEAAYVDIRAMEESLELDRLEPLAAIERLVEATWDYYLDNPTFLALVNQENLHQASFLRKSGIVKRRTTTLLRTVQKVLERGVDEGTIRPGIDPMHLNHSIAGLGFYYLNNRFTNTVLYGVNHMTPKLLSQRRVFIVDMIMRFVRCDQQ